MTAILKKLSEAEWVELLDQQGRSCACAGQRLCLSHYGVLDGGSRARARRAVGIAAFEDKKY